MCGRQQVYGAYMQMFSAVFFGYCLYPFLVIPYLFAAASLFCLFFIYFSRTFILHPKIKAAKRYCFKVYKTTMSELYENKLIFLFFYIFIKDIL